MRKLVNGKVVDIKNLELFELAAEGLALQNTAVSVTSEGLDANIDSFIIKRYIKQYDTFFKSMPYPLYAIEADIKYATLANFIKALSKEVVDMWIDKGLFIQLDANTKMCLKIVNNTWSITYSDKRKDNTNMEIYKDKIGYKEYKWILAKILNKENTANFYTEFMPDFVKACNGQPMLLKWELENILTFGIVPNRTELKQNKIIDVQYDREYTLDIYCTGTVDSNEIIQSWSMVNKKGLGTGLKHSKIKTYGFDSYSKTQYENSTSSGKLEKCKLAGLQSLFLNLCAIKNANDLSDFPVFEGIISNNNLVFTINKRLFVTKSNKITEVKEIVHGVEIYCVENNKVYFTKSKKISDKIKRDTLYSYSIKDGNIRICKIIFSY